MNGIAQPLFLHHYNVVEVVESPLLQSEKRQAGGVVTEVHAMKEHLDRTLHHLPRLRKTRVRLVVKTSVEHLHIGRDVLVAQKVNSLVVHPVLHLDPLLRGRDVRVRGDRMDKGMIPHGGGVEGEDQVAHLTVRTHPRPK